MQITVKTPESDAHLEEALHMCSDHYQFHLSHPSKLYHAMIGLIANLG